ncbi:MAG: hypothetical protein HFI29_11280 [Lachnospiraceae bacterium]|jgi:hypothetical protein|nr:hypothetical protein [Lachnospiraceae bacterium]
MWSKIQRWCILAFSGVFAVIWCWLLLVVAEGFQESKKIGLEVVLLAGSLTLIGFLIKKYGTFLWERKQIWLAGSVSLLAAMAAGLFYMGMSLRVHPGWDFGAVYLGAVELTENGVFSDQSNWYFTTYPNNVAACLFLTVFFKIFGGLCDYITLGVLLNIFLILLGLVFLLLLIRHLYGERWAFLGILLCALFLPFYMHAPIFYTDTFALPFVTGTFLAYQLRKKDARFLILTALVLALGYKVKGSLGVILIALLIHIWLQKGKALEHTKQSLLLLVPFLLLVGFLTVVPGQMSFMDTSEAEKHEFPLEHWIALGIQGSGGYNGDIYWMTASVEGKAEKAVVDRRFIQEKLEEYGFAGMCSHLKEKVLFTWGDGVYFAPEKLYRDPLKESPLHAWVLYYGENYAKTYRYCSAIHLLLLLGILLSVIRNLLDKKSRREIVAMQLAVFGLFLFLLIWETRSRYLVNFVPVFVLLGIDGLQGLPLIAALSKACLRKLRRSPGSIPEASDSPGPG